jgi:hypothetical protein
VVRRAAAVPAVPKAGLLVNETAILGTAAVHTHVEQESSANGRKMARRSPLTLNANTSM